MRTTLVFIALATLGCGKTSPTAPTEAPKPAVRTVDYAINVPTVELARTYIATFPDGVRVAPYTAQRQWDYTGAYGGSPNVYYGETAPHCEYLWVGIVVAPLHVATMDQFTSADWPGVMEPGLTYAWVGHFVHTPAAVPGASFYDPNGLSCLPR